MKTPVSVLQELLARRGTVPKYELVQIEGMIHEPTFRYRVTVADLVGKFIIHWVLQALAFFLCLVFVGSSLSPLSLPIIPIHLLEVQQL